MCAEKNNDKNGKGSASGCCDGMAEMMKDKFCGQKSDDGTKGDNQGCCG